MTKKKVKLTGQGVGMSAKTLDSVSNDLAKAAAEAEKTFARGFAEYVGILDVFGAEEVDRTPPVLDLAQLLALSCMASRIANSALRLGISIGKERAPTPAPQPGTVRERPWVRTGRTTAMLAEAAKQRSDARLAPGEQLTVVILVPNAAAQRYIRNLAEAAGIQWRHSCVADVSNRHLLDKVAGRWLALFIDHACWEEQPTATAEAVVLLSPRVLVTPRWA